MGTYRTLYADLPCRHCGVVRSVGIQFKTGDDYAMPEYKIDDVAEDVPPDLYDGIADAYCARCESRWIDDEKRVAFELLAADVEAGRVTASRATWRYGALDERHKGLVVTLSDSAPMTAADVLDLAKQPDRAPSLMKSFTARLETVALWAGELRLHPYGEDFERTSNWWVRRHKELGAALRALGWQEGADPWIDIPVRVDDDHRVRLGS